MAEDHRLSPSARRAIEETPTLFLSAVSFYEITQKVRLGKWPEMEVYAGNLLAFVDAQSLLIAPVSAEIAVMAGQLDWDHRDPFDRHLAATALMFGLDLISADTAFDSVPNLRRIW